MSNHIRYCKNCKIYTMKELCPKCGQPTIIPNPPKFSFPDKYGKYRRETKREILIREGLL